jgi:hypothetical protein
MDTDRTAGTLGLNPEIPREVRAKVDISLSDGLQIFHWWQRVNATGRYADKYDLMRQPDSPDTNFGFYDQVPLARGILPVAGMVQNMFYDRSKARQGSAARAAIWMRDQVREFVQRYFLRICSRRAPEIYVPPGAARSQPQWLRNLSFCPDPEAQRTGFGYRQLMYKEKGSGRIGVVPLEEQRRMFNLADMGTRYEWVLGRVKIFDFGLTVRAGSSFQAPELYIPVPEDVYIVFHEDLCVHRDNPAPGVLGEYGYGYTFIPNPAVDDIWAYGPEKLFSAFEYIHFRVLENGEVWVRMAFCANVPQRILIEESSFARLLLNAADRVTAGLASRLGDPLLQAYDRSALRHHQPDPTWVFIDLANLATLGLAGSELAITRRRLITNIMGAHFLMLYNLIVQTLPAFKRVPNWLDTKALPDWITHP